MLRESRFDVDFLAHGHHPVTAGFP
jgi:hypothetical protein